MDIKAAVEMLKYVKELFDKHDIDLWLDYGTLLGAVRDGKIIPWDHDIDLGVWDTHILKIDAVFQELRDNGFNVNKEGPCTSSISMPGKDWGIGIWTYKLINNKACISFFPPSPLQPIIGYILTLLTEPKYEEKDRRAPEYLTKNLRKIIKVLPLSSRIQLKTIFLKADKQIGHTKRHGSYVRIAIPSHYFTDLSTIQFYEMDFKVPAETV